MCHAMYMRFRFGNLSNKARAGAGERKEEKKTVSNINAWAMTGFDCYFSMISRILKTHQLVGHHTTHNEITNSMWPFGIRCAISSNGTYLFNHLIVVDRKWGKRGIRVKTSSWIHHSNALSNALCHHTHLPFGIVVVGGGANCLKWLLTNIYLIGFLF